MALKYFTTDFQFIGEQEFLRPNFGYRYFFDVQKAEVYPSSKSIKLKYILSEIQSPKIPKGELDDFEILVDLGNIERRFNNLINLEEVSEIGSDKTILQNGDIVIPKMQPQMGNIFLNSEHKRYIGSTELLEYKINSTYNPIYLYYLITTSKFLSDFGKLESGKTHRRVNPIDLLKIKIPLIPKEKQDQIVSQIEPIEQKIKELKSQIKPTQEIINNVFAQKFGFDIENADIKKKQLIHYASLVDFANEELKFDISLKYRYIFLNYIKKVSRIEWIELGKLLEVKGGKRLPKGQNVTEEETDYKYVRVDDLSWSGVFDLENIKYISEENHKIIRNYIAQENDILLTIVGATVGKCGLVPIELDGENITENFARLIINDKEEYLPEYVNYCLQSKTSVFQIDEYKGRSSQGKLALFRVKKIKIPKIPKTQQQQIVNEIKAELGEQEKIKKEIVEERKKIDETIENCIHTF